MSWPVRFVSDQNLCNSRNRNWYDLKNGTLVGTSYSCWKNQSSGIEHVQRKKITSHLTYPVLPRARLNVVVLNVRLIPNIILNFLFETNKTRGVTQKGKGNITTGSLLANDSWKLNSNLIIISRRFLIKNAQITPSSWSMHFFRQTTHKIFILIGLLSWLVRAFCVY